MGLNQLIIGGTRLFNPPSADEVLYGNSNASVPRLVDTTCPRINTAEELREQYPLKYVYVRSASRSPFQEEESDNSSR